MASAGRLHSKALGNSPVSPTAALAGSQTDKPAPTAHISFPLKTTSSSTGLSPSHPAVTEAAPGMHSSRPCVSFPSRSAVLRPQVALHHAQDQCRAEWRQCRQHSPATRPHHPTCSREWQQTCPNAGKGKEQRATAAKGDSGTALAPPVSPILTWLHPAATKHRGCCPGQGTAVLFCLFLLLNTP